MFKKGLASKLDHLPVGKLNVPKGGVFAGRSLPPAKEDDANWLRVLELKRPPEDGLYISRSDLLEKPKEKQSSDREGFLHKIARKMVEIEQSKKIPPPKPKYKPSAEPIAKVPQVDDWNTLSPDMETSYLGLEQLEHGESISIIGAGITGLTLAWILNRSRPDVHIHIYDSKTDVGGWMGSKFVDLPNGAGKTLFESGPRTLLPSHPGSEIVNRILCEIGKRDELLAGVPRDSPTNQKALVYDGKIEQLPNALGETVKFGLNSPLMKKVRWSILKDLWRPARKSSIDDESVRSFIARRVGAPLADRMASAIMRGIYAADVDKLSARSVARLNRLYYLERTEKMSILGAMLSGSVGYLDQYAKEALPVVFDALAPPLDRKKPVEHRHLINREHPIPKFSLYGFKGGIQNMVRAIADDLQQKKNVKLHLSTGVTAVKKGDNARTVNLNLQDGSTKSTNIVVSTVASPALFANESETLARDLGKVKYSSLAVVNVWVPDPHAAKDWFGILVPKTEDTWNTDGVLGVIFDSSVRNAMTSDPAQKEKAGSSMTVMIGGDLWDDKMTEEDAKQRALNFLKKLKLVDPKTTLNDTITQATLQRNAIPLYEVGHSKRQQEVMAELQKTYNGRVALIGMAFGRGCGVSDCVVDALTVALRFSDQRKLLYPSFFFNHWWTATRPEYYA